MRSGTSESKRGSERPLGVVGAAYMDGPYTVQFGVSALMAGTSTSPGHALDHVSTWRRVRLSHDLYAFDTCAPVRLPRTRARLAEGQLSLNVKRTHGT